MTATATAAGTVTTMVIIRMEVDPAGHLQEHEQAQKKIYPTSNSSRPSGSRLKFKLIKSGDFNSKFRILKLENRSFDHYLGWLKEFNNKINGLTGKEFNCVDIGSNTSCVYVNKNGFDVGPDDPKHDFYSVGQQIYGFNKSVSQTATPKSNGYVWNAAMSMFTINSSSANILNSLALIYGVFDEWFCSVPSLTDPNRGFAMNGTSNGMITNYNGTAWSQESYFEFLRKQNVTFDTCYDSHLWGIAYFADMQKQPNSLHIKNIAQFYSDLGGDELASFIWLQPSMTTSDSSNDNCDKNNDGNHGVGGVDSIVINNDDDVDDMQLELSLTMAYDVRLMICRYEAYELYEKYV